MNKNKKYAIRKLAVGVASISIGMFISNTPEISQTLGSVGGRVIQAFDNGTGNTSNETTKDWKPEGSIIATGEDGVPWELYENGYLLFKPEPGKDTLSNRKDGVAYWKTQNLDRKKIKAIGFTDKVYLPEDSSNLFSSDGKGDSLLSAGVSFLETSKIDTSKVKNMSGMFNFTAFTELDLNNWDTSNVEDMSALFAKSGFLTTLKIDKWNTSKVKNMSNMFAELTLKELNISDWNTSNVEDMSAMFSHMFDLLKLDLNK